MKLDIRKYVTEPLYRNSLAIMLSTLVAGVFGFGFWIIAARTISSYDVGLATAVIAAATMISALARIGLDVSLIRFIPESKNAAGLYSNSVYIPIILSLLLSAIYLAGIEVFSPSLAFLRNGLFTVMFITYIVTYSLNTTQNMLLVALRRADLQLLQNLTLGARLPILFVVSSLGVISILATINIAYLASVLIGLYLVYKLGIRPSRKIDWISLKNTFKFSIGNYVATLFSIAPTTVVPLLIVNLLGPDDCAYYYIAYYIMSILLMVPFGISISLFVEGSHNLPLMANVVKSTKFMLAMLLPMIFVTVLFGDRILMLFSHEYSSHSFQMLQLLAVSSLFSGITYIYISIKKVQKDVSAINFLSVLTSGLLIALGYVLIPMYGLTGLGYAWLISNLAGFGVVITSIAYDRRKLRKEKPSAEVIPLAGTAEAGR